MVSQWLAGVGGTVCLYRRTRPRMHSRRLLITVVVNNMPKFAASFMLLFKRTMRHSPGYVRFVGEFLVIMGAVKANFWYAFPCCYHAYSVLRHLVDVQGDLR